jgi:hypothetical protein
VRPDRHIAVTTHYPMLAGALERHLGWASDFAMAGDIDSAADAIRDAQATFAEQRASRSGGPCEPPFVTMSQMMDRDALSELEAIAARSAKAADAGGVESELLGAYESLRARATALALAHGWATAEELADQFPTSRSLREIERLDLAFGSESSPALAPDRGMSARLREGLTELSAWASGVRLAYQTLDDERSGDA